MLAHRLSSTAQSEAASKLLNLDDLQKKLSFSLKQPAPNGAETNLPAALDLVHRAAEVMEFLQKRAQDVEGWALRAIQQLEEQLAQATAREKDFEDRIRATEFLAREIQSKLSVSEQKASQAEERLASAEAEIAAAEARAAQAEERATKTEAWLAHAEQVITTKLSSFSAIMGKLPADDGTVVKLEGKFTKPNQSQNR
jgi:chromosome segregation ATPase